MNEFSSLGSFAKAVAATGRYPNQTDPRLRASVNTVTPSEGGYLLPGQQANVLARKAFGGNAILQRVTRPVADDASSAAWVPVISEASRADGARYGGMSLYWVEQGAAITPSKPAFGRLELRRKRCAGVVPISDEMLRASPAALSSYLEPVFAEALADALAEAVVAGSGAGMPQGILQSPAKIVVNRSAPSTIAAADVRNMVARLWGGSFSTAAWLVSESCMAQVLALAGSLLSINDGLRLCGWPVIPTEYAQPLGTTGDIALVDLSEYQLSSSVLRLDYREHARFVECEGYYRLTVNADGCLSWQSAVGSRAPTRRR